MSGDERAHSAYNDVFEIWRAAQGEVCPSTFICCLLITILAGSPREEKPALQGVAPRSRLVDKIPCRVSEEYGKIKQREQEKEATMMETKQITAPGGSIPAADFRD